MDIVKKNWLSIVCGVIALAALVAVFLWPLDGYFDTLKEKADKRAAIEGKVKSLMNKTRGIPVYDPNNPAAAKLTKFPSNDIIKRTEGAKKGVHSESTRAYDAAWQLNARPVLISGSLPSPLTADIAIYFRNNLMKALDKVRAEELLAGTPPTPEEFNNRADALWQSMKSDIIMVNEQPANLEQVMSKYNDRLSKLPEEMKKEMATNRKMYIDPLAVMMVSNSLPADGKPPSPQAIWWSQVAYWITTDVAAAIKEVNASSSSVTDSPVKNLLVLTIPEDFFPPIGPGTAGGRGAEADSADAATPATGGLPDPTLTLPDGAAQSPTKRTSNNLFDVVHFHMSLDIEADKVTLFLKTLATNRFITVIRFEMNPVDSQLKQIQGYVYGTRPVVTLDLDCEALFLRQWTIKLMPVNIKKALSIPTDSPSGTPSRGGRGV